eukprot:gene2664-2964_t
MLDAALPHAGAAGDVLGSAAAQRLRALAEDPAAGGAAGGAAAAAGPSVVRRLFRAVWDSVLGITVLASVVGGYMYYRYSISEVEQMLKDTQVAAESSVTSQVWAEVLQAYLAVAVPVSQKVREYTDPTCDALLPELAPELRGRVKTLVVDLEGLLVHKEWTRAKGWQVLKRPGVEAFLLEMGKRYEVVLYTDEQAMYADPVINKIDPHRAITYRLYRQDTQYKDGKHVRDLSKLNRDLTQVLFISGNPHDTTLLDLIPFLQMVQEVHVDDVRDVVRSYDGEEDVAVAFKQRMAQLAQHKKQGGGRFKGH